MFYDRLHSLRIEIFTTEYIQIGIPGLVAKVPSDVACLDQLDQGKACLVAFSEVLDHRLPIRHHINSLHKVNCECVNICFITNKVNWASEGIEDGVLTPHINCQHYKMPTKPSYYMEHREQCMENTRKYAAANREKIKEKQREYYQKVLKARRQRDRAYANADKPPKVKKPVVKTTKKFFGAPIVLPTVEVKLPEALPGVTIKPGVIIDWSL